MRVVNDDDDDSIEQRSPTFLAPGTGFVEDSFSTGGGRAGDGSGRHAGDGEQR